MSNVPLRVLVTGSRDLTDESVVLTALQAVVEYAAGRPIVIVHGACRGADLLVARLAAATIPGVTIEPHPAEWAKFGKSAGPRRNAAMVNSGVEICAAFFIRGWQSRGTAGCCRLAVQAGVPVRWWYQEPPAVGS